MKDLHPQVKKSIILICLAALLIITLLSFLNKAGQVGNYYKFCLDKLMGYGLWLVPLVLILIIWQRKLIFRIGLALFILSLLGIFQVSGLKGGYLGAAASYFLLKYAGTPVSFIILFSLLVIAVLISLNIPILELIKNKKQDIKEKIVQRRSAIKTESEPESEQSVGNDLKPFPTTWTAPSLKLLEQDAGTSVSAGNVENNQRVIQKTLENFGIMVEMADVNIGPTVTQYTLRPDIGVKLAKITALQNDLSLALAAHPLRIEAPIPGKSLVGIEVPNQKISIVRLGPLLANEVFKKDKALLALALGRDVAGQPFYADLCRMPHLLIAGSTGSGKTICINNIILSLLYKNSPNNLKLILIDPKRVELTAYNNIPHLFTPVVVDHKKAIEVLKWAISEMESRFKKLQNAGARNIAGYKDEDMPYLVIVIDELADLMAAFGREVEAAIVRLAQMSRAVGIHLVVSTQRPSVEVITGLIKANITSRIAFQVASQVDSRTILDMAGAEKLLGNGDMLFLSGDASRPRRIQGALVTEKEVKNIVKELSVNSNQLSALEKKEDEREENKETRKQVEPDDDLYEQAKELVIRSRRASASMLQRYLKVGYARAARLLDILEANGVVGPGDGARPRDVLIKK
ncbi:MAG: DNA translocase FtsK [bacterium]